MAVKTQANPTKSDSKLSTLTSTNTGIMECNPSHGTPYERIRHLQRTIGNRAVGQLLSSGLLQAKLRIERPNDRYEQKVDCIADQVMRTPDAFIQRQPEDLDEDRTIQQKPIAERITPLDQRSVSENDLDQEQRTSSGNLHREQRIQRRSRQLNPRYHPKAPRKFKTTHTWLLRRRKPEDGYIPAYAMRMGRGTIPMHYGVPVRTDKSGRKIYSHHPPEVEQYAVEKLDLDGIAGAPPSLARRVIEVRYDLGIDPKNRSKHIKGPGVKVLCVDTMTKFGYPHKIRMRVKDGRISPRGKWTTVPIPVAHNLELSPNAIVKGGMLSKPYSLPTGSTNLIRYPHYMYPVYYKVVTQQPDRTLKIRPKTLKRKKTYPWYWRARFLRKWAKLDYKTKMTIVRMIGDPIRLTLGVKRLTREIVKYLKRMIPGL
jgi:hypothetical protein